MNGPMTKHQNLAQHDDPYEDQPMSKGTGGLRNNDAHVPEAGEGHVHETDPSKEGSQHHGEHGHGGHGSVNEGHHHGGHKHMHEHHPEGHSGGHKKGNY